MVVEANVMACDACTRTFGIDDPKIYTGAELTEEVRRHAHAQGWTTTLDLEDFCPIHT
jgi:hypothetical protein